MSATPETIVRCCLRDIGDIKKSIHYCRGIARNASFNPWGDPTTAPNYTRAAEILEAKLAAMEAKLCEK